MKTVYEKQIEAAKNLILNSNDSDLFSKGFEEKLYQKLKIESPLLDVDSVSVKIDSEVINSERPPLNITFSHGRPLEYAVFITPVLGNTDLFYDSFKSYFHSLSSYQFEQGRLIFKLFSQTTISGNTVEINRIKDVFTNNINDFQRQLEEIKTRTNYFNVDELKDLISKTTASEIKKRKVKKESENQLNPFA